MDSPIKSLKKTRQIPNDMPTAIMALVILPTVSSEDEEDGKKYVDEKAYRKTCLLNSTVSVRLQPTQSVIKDVRVSSGLMGRIKFPTVNEPQTTTLLLVKKFPDNGYLAIASFDEYGQSSDIVYASNGSGNTTRRGSLSDSKTYFVEVSSSDGALISLHAKGTNSYVKFESENHMESRSNTYGVNSEETLSLQCVNGDNSSGMFALPESLNLSVNQASINIYPDKIEIGDGKVQKESVAKADEILNAFNDLIDALLKGLSSGSLLGVTEIEALKAKLSSKPFHSNFLKTE